MSCDEIGNWVEVAHEEYLCEDCFESSYAQCEECFNVYGKEDGEWRDDEEQVFWCLECIEKEEEREEDDDDNFTCDKCGCEKNREYHVSVDGDESGNTICEDCVDQYIAEREV